jgi:hypothetical protein
MKTELKKMAGMAVVTVTVLLAGPAEAVLYGFAGLDITEENLAAQLFVDVTDYAPGLVRFDAINRGPIASGIATVYFDHDDALPSLLSDIVALDESDPGVDFAYPATTGDNLPEGGNVLPPFETDWWTTKEGPESSAINGGESLGMIFGLAEGRTFEEVIGSLDSGHLRVGYHVISIGSREDSDSYLVTVNGRQVADGGMTLMLLGTAVLGLEVLRRKSAQPVL